MQRHAHIIGASFAAAVAVGLAFATPLPAAAQGNGAAKQARKLPPGQAKKATQATAQAVVAPPAPLPSVAPAASTTPISTAPAAPRPFTTATAAAAAAAAAAAPAPASTAGSGALVVPAPQTEKVPVAPPDEPVLALLLPSVLPAGLPPGISIPLLLFPLLIGLWLILAARTLTAAYRQRDRRVRHLAATLDLDPTLAKQLVNVPPTALTVLQDRVDAVAFDDLTGVLRRGAGEAALEREVARAHRGDTSLSLAFIDIDGLKAMNDSHGHAAGDALIKAVAAALQRRLRAADLLFRYGGDEFVCVLPDTTVDQAAAVLEAIKRDTALVGASFSFGLASCHRGDSSETLLARADSRLYATRRSA